MAAIQLDDVVNEGLTRWREGKGFGWVRRVVFCRMGLADFEVFARGRGGEGGGGNGGGVGGHCFFLFFLFVWD